MGKLGRVITKAVIFSGIIIGFGLFSNSIGMVICVAIIGAFLMEVTTMDERS